MAKKTLPKKDKPNEAAAPPQQQLGDTPVAPWQMPTPAEKAAVEPVREALQQAVAEVDSQEKAEAVIDQLAAATAATSVEEVADTTAPPVAPADAAHKIASIAQTAPDGASAPAVLAETARVLATAQGPEQEAVAEAAQEVFNPEQQGAPPVQERQRERLRRALLHRLKPLDALDANLFLRINHLPHTRLLNGFFYTLTVIFNGGVAWYALMAAILLWNRRLGWRIPRESVVPLALATSLVEYPIKRYFRRKRPFITIIKAIVIGQKPGTWSFPSGHSATAFAGAWLLSRYFPRQRGWFYTVASLVAFSHVYLGDHYPGDVLSGSTLGMIFAEFFRRLGRTPRR